jgi:hypothetical protein
MSAPLQAANVKRRGTPTAAPARWMRTGHAFADR